MSLNLFEAAFPHLDDEVNGLTPAYLPEVLFKCRSALDKGGRPDIEDGGRDRDAEWIILSGPVVMSQQQPVFETTVGLRFLVEDRTRNEQDAVNVAHTLAAGVMGDFLNTDRRGVPGVTGILAIAVLVGTEPTYTIVATGIIVTIPILIRHGSC